jgi:hypothetical protein
VTFRVDYIGEESGFFVNVWPEGLGTGATNAERIAGSVPVDLREPLPATMQNESQRVTIAVALAGV